MNLFKSLALAAAIGITSQACLGQTTPPTTPPTPTPDTAPPDVIWTSPLSSTQYHTNTIAIAGQATDPNSIGGTPGANGSVTGGTPVPASGIARVEYRISGQSWKKLMMVNPGDRQTLFFGTLKLGAGKSTRFSIRCFDRVGNEGFTYTQIIRRSRATRKYQSG